MSGVSRMIEALSGSRLRRVSKFVAQTALVTAAAAVLAVGLVQLMPCPDVSRGIDATIPPLGTYDHMLVQLPPPKSIPLPDDGFVFYYASYGPNSANPGFPSKVLVLQGEQSALPNVLDVLFGRDALTLKALSAEEVSKAVGILRQLNYFNWPSMPYKMPGPHPRWEEIIVYTPHRTHRVVLGELPHISSRPLDSLPSSRKSTATPDADRLRTLAQNFRLLELRMREIARTSHKQQHNAADR